ncbi:MAG: threonine aldolase [Bacteroidetes bacterium]|nr:MAG: threonine aldolase [Bacteroidota bacterium]
MQLYNDYSEGAHTNILKALLQTNLKQQDGYSEDDYSLEAKNILHAKIKNTNADIHFVSGGTQANLIVISSILKSYQSVIAANSAHINIHEAGAIEATGHKIHGVESLDGKLSPEQIKPILEEHTDEHMVKPAMVFISNSTELGTIYKKNELEELSTFCRQNNLILYLDGARLGVALSSKENDLSLPELAKLVDVFYVGGTKNGALIGEAIVIVNDKLKQNFRFHLKQHGALLAKGRLLGIQFVELLKDNLFFELAEHANSMALKLSKGIAKLGYNFLTKPETNQIFPIIPNSIIEKLNIKHGFYVWSKDENNMSVIRLVTSWATKEEEIYEFMNDLKEYS